MTLGADMKTARERIVVKRTKTTRQSLSITCRVKVTEQQNNSQQTSPTMAALFHLAATSLSLWSCFILLEITRISL